uniref:Pseudouridine synthase n=1 Tax=Plectus sambesii TaxID=2011161 RepID=A0A914X3X6_9BILA
MAEVDQERAPNDNENQTCPPASKRAKRQKQEDDEIEMPPPQFTITNGVRFVKPYWGAYKTFAKGRWVGHKLVDIFKKEFLGADPNYMIAAVKLGRFIVNGKCANVDHVIGGRDVIVHYRHRHELPVLDAPLEIIADTDDLLVVNKPPSVPVHACGSYNYHTVISLLHLLHGYKRADLRLLHRLDRTTSGVLLFAKNYATDLKFKTTLGDGHWRKEYICMVDGEFPAEEMVCDKKIGVLVSSMGVQCIRDDGKEARTRFRRSWTDGKRSLVRCYPETGRTHQIRVHLQYLGFPIVNDQLYNKDVWGPNKGKNGDYGMPFDELCEGVKKAHRSELWHIDGTLDPKYTERMRRAADEDLEQEPNLPCDQRPEIDIYCRECHLLKKEVPHDHFVMYLHCLKYETDDWSFTAPLPDWAKEAEAGSEQRVLA